MTHKEKYFNILFTITLLGLATLLSFFFFHIAPSHSANIALLYILAIITISRCTYGYLPGITAALVGVICVNFLFTYPYFELDFTLSGYPVSFICMLAVSLITCTLTTHLKRQAKIITEREKLLAEAEKEKMRANLLRAISHDLRTPLTGIIGASNSYLENEASLSTEEKHDLLEHIREDSNWLLNMVENLLSVTRIRESSTHVTTSLEPVEEVVSEAVMRLKKRIPDARISVKVPDELLMIPMDAILIEQVIMNLLENAVIHSKSQKEINCYIDTDDTYAIFHIRDYGIGISPDQIDTIFDGSTFMPSGSADGQKGMGIGLSICQTIILAHGGSIHAVNHEEGAEFYFTLPKEELN